MVVLNFLTDKVRKYQEKKLNDAIQKLKLHQKLKKRLESELKTTNDESNSIKNEIKKQNENITIWEKNIITIKEQIKKL